MLSRTMNTGTHWVERVTGLQCRLLELLQPLGSLYWHRSSTGVLLPPLKAPIMLDLLVVVLKPWRRIKST